MNQTVAIQLNDISKKYSIYDSQKNRIKEMLSPKRAKYHREFWALKNINLKIPRGETIGILGLNGSGKSTLLKVISSVLSPSSGNLTVNGRVSALLELGAGFNPQLTGLENAKLNLAIKGLNKKKIDEAIPVIMDFAEIGDFFYQPVNTYSSGMFSRLAFATAITVEPDILIIDETLSVGDAKFQQKCFKKFAHFQENGKTILFVTHDRFSIARLCSMAVLLDKGQLLEVGNPKNVVESYSLLLSDAHTLVKSPDLNESPPPLLTTTTKENKVLNYLLRNGQDDNCSSNSTYNKNEFRYGTQEARIVNYCIEVGQTLNPVTFFSGSHVKIYVLMKFHKDMDHPIIGYNVKSKDGIVASALNSRWLREELPPKKAGDMGVYCLDIHLNLCDGDWFIDLALTDSETGPVSDIREGMIHLDILSNNAAKGIAFLETKICEVPIE